MQGIQKGFEPASAWWEQVLGVTSEGQIPVLVYKFDNKPIRIRVQAKVLNPVLDNEDKLLDLNWDSFIYLLRTLYNEDLEEHDK